MTQPIVTSYRQKYKFTKNNCILKKKSKFDKNYENKGAYTKFPTNENNYKNVNMTLKMINKLRNKSKIRTKIRHPKMSK